MMLAMHGVVVECIFAEDCCEMMGCVVMATWCLLCVGVWFDCLILGGIYVHLLLSKRTST